MALPLPFVLQYGDGAETLDRLIDLIAFPFLVNSLATGHFYIDVSAGYGGVQYGFLAQVSQLGAYGMFLIDTLDPPEAEVFEVIHCPPPTDLVIQEATSVAFTQVDQCS